MTGTCSHTQEDGPFHLAITSDEQYTARHIVDQHNEIYIFLFSKYALLGFHHMVKQEGRGERSQTKFLWVATSSLLAHSSRDWILLQSDAYTDV